MAAQTRFLILSDTHNFEHDPTQSYPLCQQMPKVDVVLHCGDLTQIGGMSAYRKALTMFSNFDAELKLVIAGSHDISLDGEYWRTHLDEDDEAEEHDAAVGIMTGPRATAAGVTYLTEGLHKFSLKNGSTFTIFVSPYQPECGDWAFGYKRGEERFSIPADADIVMTHGPPAGSLDLARDQHLGCESLLKAVERTRPLLHCFGHIHEGYGAAVKHWDGARAGDGIECAVTFVKAGDMEGVQKATVTRGSSTLRVNAAIMDERNRPTNAPWIVELPLEKAIA